MQTKRQSLVETLVNVAIGYGVAVGSNVLIFPVFGIHIDLADNLTLGGFMTVVSICRSYAVRRWRFDFAWPSKKLAVEVEGGIFVNGAHTRGKHFISDCDKYNEATRMGWRVLRFTKQHVRVWSPISFLKKWFYEF